MRAPQISRRARAAAATLALAIVTAGATAQVHEPGRTYWGANRYIEYVAGDAPLVVSAPHDGSLRPSSIPDRTYGTFVRDSNSSLAARALVDEFVQATGRRPHLIVCHLHRTKLDANREIVEAAQGNSFAEQAWRDYHAFIDAAKARAVARFGRGLYVDVHGHGHAMAWIELGYLLSSSTLALPNATLNQPQYAQTSSIRALATIAPVPFSQLLRGSNSLGGLLAVRGHPSVPAPLIPSPNGNPYFTGGYNTQRHGSRGGGTVDAVQFELPSSERSTASARAAFGRDSAAGIADYLNVQYGIDLRTPPTLSIAAVDDRAAEAGEEARFRITRSGNTAQSLAVGFRVSGRATPLFDYVSLGTSALIPAGSASVDLVVRPVDDGLAEGTETVTLSLVEGAAVAGAGDATVVILDDESDPDLAARWSLNRMRGPTVPDESGGGNDGQLEPNATTGPTTTAGRHQGGLGFDEVDDRVRVGDFDYASGNGDFTLTFWFRAPPASTQSSYQYVWSHGMVSAAHSLNVYLEESTGELRTNLRFGNNLSAASDLDVNGFMDGAWHHYAVSADADGLTEVFVDGIGRLGVRLGGDALAPAGDARIGGRVDLSAPRFFAGELDELRVYRRPLSPAEIKALAADTPAWSTQYGAGCAGAAGVPTHSLQGVPALGFVPELRVDGAAASVPTAFVLGASASAWGPAPLPLVLDAFGAPGCALLAAPDASTWSATDPTGIARLGLRIPLDPSALGARLFTQCLVLDPTANPLGLAASNGVETVLGGGF